MERFPSFHSSLVRTGILLLCCRQEQKTRRKENSLLSLPWEGKFNTPIQQKKIYISAKEFSWSRRGDVQKSNINYVHRYYILHIGEGILTQQILRGIVQLLQKRLPYASFSRQILLLAPSRVSKSPTSLFKKGGWHLNAPLSLLSLWYSEPSSLCRRGWKMLMAPTNPYIHTVVV